MGSRLLFIRTDRLGETLLNLPVLHALRTALPHASIILMTHPALRELLDGHPDLSDVREEPVMPGPWWWRAWRLSRVWRAWKPDTLIISNPKKEYHLAAWLAGIPIRVGYDRKWGWLLTHRLADRKALGACHEITYNMGLLANLKLPLQETSVLTLPVSKQAEESFSQLMNRLGVGNEERLVSVHPWTSNPKKQWPLERFRMLLDRLGSIPGVRPMLIGGPQERARAGEVLPGVSPRLMNLIGRLSLKELAACLRRARVVITNDSGPMHLAAAVGTPVVALFGTEDAGSHPRRWGPWGSGHTVIHKPLEEITVEEVLAAVQRYLP
ncbi:MAG: glycosyltransferase family 9 protein [Candidatus Omnitrophica bacterium]|nr:glycosyltransferase family 9 protein [Candidatus Omnitrophota bacterium]